VLGNKKDLKQKKSVLERGDLMQLDGAKFKEVSALNNLGIREAFKEIIMDLESDMIL